MAFHLVIYFYCKIFFILIFIIDSPSTRSEVWRLILGYSPSNTELKEKTIKNKRKDYFQATEMYNILLENPQKNMNETEYSIYKQILKDLPRTMPEYKIFSFDKINKIMLRILYVWSLRHPASGYVQGFNDLCTPFILVFLAQYINELDYDNLENFSEELLNEMKEDILWEIEADSYNCFTAMMNKIQNNYTNNQPGLHKMLNKMEDIIKLVDKDVILHFEKNEVTFLQFSFRWMNCYLMREFSLKLIIRLWDTYFSEEDAFNTFHLFVCAGLLLNFSEKIKKMNFQEIISFLQNLPTNTWTLDDIKILLAKAYQINVLYGKILTNNFSK